MSSPTKRLRDDSTTDELDTVTVKSARTNGASNDSAAQQLAQVLRLGVFSYLSIHDAAAVLHCCKAFWEDTELATLALLDSPAREFAQHFGTKCHFDWFSVDPFRCATGYSDSDGFCGGNHEEDVNDVVKSRAMPTIDARLVAVVADVAAYVVPAHPAYLQAVTLWHDQVCAVPVVISLRNYHPNGLNLPYFHDWSREDVRVALNALRPSFGDRFVDSDPAHAYASDFGLHWDNTSLSPETGNAECMLCGVAQYIYARQKAQELDERNHRERGGARGAVDASERPIGSAMRTLLESPLSVKYEHVEAALQGLPDPDITDVVEAADLVVFPIEGEEGYKHDCYGDGDDEMEHNAASLHNVSHPMSEFPTVCAAVVQPLNQFLLHTCDFTHRMKYPWLFDNVYEPDYMNGNAVVELCAGITPSGYLCGTFFLRSVNGRIDQSLCVAKRQPQQQQQQQNNATYATPHSSTTISISLDDNMGLLAVFSAAYEVSTVVTDVILNAEYIRRGWLEEYVLSIAFLVFSGLVMGLVGVALERSHRNRYTHITPINTAVAFLLGVLQLRILVETAVVFHASRVAARAASSQPAQLQTAPRSNNTATTGAGAGYTPPSATDAAAHVRRLENGLKFAAFVQAIVRDIPLFVIQANATIHYRKWQLLDLYAVASTGITLLLAVGAYVCKRDRGALRLASYAFICGQFVLRAGAILLVAMTTKLVVAYYAAAIAISAVLWCSLLHTAHTSERWSVQLTRATLFFPFFTLFVVDASQLTARGGASARETLLGRKLWAMHAWRTLESAAGVLFAVYFTRYTDFGSVSDQTIVLAAAVCAGVFAASLALFVATAACTATPKAQQFDDDAAAAESTQQIRAPTVPYSTMAAHQV